MGRQRPVWPDNYYSLLRNEAKFGCAKCGVPQPIFIHHIEGYREGFLEIPEKLIMLCDDHHHDADNDIILKSDLYELKKMPYNNKSVLHKFNIPDPNKIAIHIGSNQIINFGIPLQIFGDEIISIKQENGEILLSAKFYDLNDNLKLKIIDNVWIADTSVADVRYSENTSGSDSWLSIKMYYSKSFLDLKIISGELYIEGIFYKKGKKFEVNPSGTFTEGNLETTFRNNTITNSTMKSFSVGININ